MRSLSFVCLTGLAAVALFAPTSPAHACSPLDGCLELGSVQPADGATDVLRNVELRLNYHVDAERERLDVLPTVLDAQGQAVEFAWTRSLAMLRGKPREPLTAASTYTIRHPFAPCAGSACSDRSLCASEVGATIATFTTGDIVDDTSPLAPVFGEPVITKTLRETMSSACGPYDRCTNVRKVAPLEAGHILRLMQGDKTIVEQGSGLDLSLRVYVEGSRFTAISGAPEQLGAATYEAYVVDEAGNRSTPVALSVPACAPFVGGVSDAGVFATQQGDASQASSDAASPRGDAAPAFARSGGDGCSAASSASDTTGTWAWLLTLALCLRRSVRARRKSLLAS